MVKAVIELWFDEVADAFDAVENAKDFYNDEKQSWLFEKATKFLAYIEDASDDE